MNNLEIDIRKTKEIGLKHCKSVIDEINGYQPKDVPVRPSELNDFYNQSKQAQKDISAKFFQQEHIKEYLDEKWEVESYNRNCFFRLYELHEGINSGYEQFEVSESDKIAIKTKMDMFYRKIMSNPNPVRAMIIDFTKYGYGKPKPENQTVIDDLNNGWEE